MTKRTPEALVRKASLCLGDLKPGAFYRDYPNGPLGRFEIKQFSEQDRQHALDDLRHILTEWLENYPDSLAEWISNRSRPHEDPETRSVLNSYYWAAASS